MDLLQFHIQPNYTCSCLISHWTLQKPPPLFYTWMDLTSTTLIGSHQHKYPIYPITFFLHISPSLVCHGTAFILYSLCAHLYHLAVFFSLPSANMALLSFSPSMPSFHDKKIMNAFYQTVSLTSLTLGSCYPPVSFWICFGFSSLKYTCSCYLCSVF